MSAKYPIVAVFLDGTTPSIGPPLLPSAQTLAITAATDADIVVSFVGQDGTAYSATGTATLSVNGTSVVSGTVTSATLLTLSITAAQTELVAQVYGYELTFVDNSAKEWLLVPFSIYAILPSPGGSSGQLPDVTYDASSFRYAVAQPADGNNFTVGIPASAQMGSSYGVGIQTVSDNALCVYTAPIAGRTSSSLQIISSAPPDDGTVLEIAIYRLVS